MEHSTYENWNILEPSNYGQEDYGALTVSHKWNDVSLNGFLPFTMQLDKSATNTSSVTCNGGNDGQTYVTAAGGTAPYSYLWDNGQTTDTAYNLIAGDYIVTVTDANGCTTTDTATITEPAVISGTDTQIACDSLTWIDGITYTSSNNTATHTLTAANGCDSIVSLDLTIHYSPVFSFASDTITA